MDARKKAQLANYARDGYRITYTAVGAPKPKTLWAGLGNRAGLHSFSSTVLANKWAKSGASFLRRIDSLEQGVINVQEFRNVSRDRGRWETFETFEFGDGEPESAAAPEEPWDVGEKEYDVLRGATYLFSIWADGPREVIRMLQSKGYKGVNIIDVDTDESIGSI